MEITVQEVQAKVPVTIMRLEGELDASNYLQVVARTRELYAAGTRRILLDLGDLLFMASSGLLALHSIVLIMSGAEPPDLEYGWNSFRAAAKAAQGQPTTVCKVLNPLPSVKRTLEVSGFDTFLGVYTDLQTALAAF